MAGTGRFAELDLPAPACAAGRSMASAQRGQLTRTAVSDARTT